VHDVIAKQAQAQAGTGAATGGAKP